MEVNWKPVLFFLIFFILFTIASDGRTQEVELPPIEIDYYGLDRVLLYDAFGEDETLWTDEQKKIEQEYMQCIDEWWIDATEEQKENVPELRIVWLCWKWTFLNSQ